MEKLALGLSLVSFLFIILFLCIHYWQKLKITLRLSARRWTSVLKILKIDVRFSQILRLKAPIYQTVIKTKNYNSSLPNC